MSFSSSLNDHFANHAGTTVRLAVVVVCTGFGEGFLPGFAGIEGEIRVAELVMAFENGVVRSQFVVHKLDGVASTNRDGASLRRLLPEQNRR